MTEDEISHCLEQITKKLHKCGHQISGGCLGSEFGYGGYYDSPVFEMRPYYWGDCTCGADETEEEHKDDCALMLPNFRHKKTGFEVRWYKYIGRGMEITNAHPDLKEVFNECMESVK